MGSAYQCRDIFARFKTMQGKSWYPKRKLEITMHFSEIIKIQFGKERHTLPCILKRLLINLFLLLDSLSLKNAWLPPIFFLD